MIKRKILILLLAAAATGVYAQSFAKAEAFLDHGLTAEAQKELIDLVYSQGNALDKPKALNLLASIALDKNNLKVAIDTWSRLIQLYPTSPEAVSAKKRLPQLAGVLGQASDEIINDATARVLLRNADFWAKGRDRAFEIDASWIDNVEAAVFWYDKAIKEHPGTPAARLAYEEKIRTLIGWRDPGQSGRAHGLLRSIHIYLPLLESTFREYEKAFPQAAAIQAFRFQVAQAFWGAKNWAKTKELLAEIIEKDGGANTFYKDLAERRLRKVEY